MGFRWNERGERRVSPVCSDQLGGRCCRALPKMERESGSGAVEVGNDGEQKRSYGVPTNYLDGYFALP
jgi:hypothetical protein